MDNGKISGVLVLANLSSWLRNSERSDPSRLQRKISGENLVLDTSFYVIVLLIYGLQIRTFSQDVL